MTDKGYTSRLQPFKTQGLKPEPRGARKLYIFFTSLMFLSNPRSEAGERHSPGKLYIFLVT